MKSSDLAINCSIGLPAAPPPHARVLVIEDDEDACYLMKMLLEGQGYEVVTVENTAQILTQIDKLLIDLIIINIALPMEDGLRSLPQIRSQFPFHDIPIIVTSGHAAPSFRQKVLQAGGNQVLIKPIDFEMLDSTIKNCLAQRDVIP